MLQKIRKHKFLFSELVKRDFKKKYKGTIVGMGWSALSPLLTLLIMRLVFTHFFGSSIPHYTIYLFCGNLVFSYFRDSTTQGMEALSSNAPIFTKCNVPKYLFLLSKNVESLINFGITIIILFIFCIIDGITFTWKFVLLIYPILTVFLFNVGVGFILSALRVFYKDISYLWRVFTLLVMYVSAIFYSTKTYSETIQKLFYINPIYTYITYFRSIIIDGVIPSIEVHALMLIYAVVFTSIGLLIYKKYNHKFLYYV